MIVATTCTIVEWKAAFQGNQDFFFARRHLNCNLTSEFLSWKRERVCFGVITFG